MIIRVLRLLSFLILFKIRLWFARLVIVPILFVLVISVSIPFVIATNIYGEHIVRPALDHLFERIKILIISFVEWRKPDGLEQMGNTKSKD